MLTGGLLRSVSSLVCLLSVTPSKMNPSSSCFIRSGASWENFLTLGNFSVLLPLFGLPVNATFSGIFGSKDDIASATARPGWS